MVKYYNRKSGFILDVSCRKGLVVMRKKQMLATLVMLSLLQGSVYAETINPGIYDKYVSVNIDGDQRTIINTPGEKYNFKGGLSIDRNINASMDKYNSIIGLESSANDSDKKLEITIGSENVNSDKVNIKLNSVHALTYICL